MNKPDQISMSEDEFREVISEAIEQAFTRMGIDNGRPLSMQEDFAYLRKLRKASENIANKSLMTIVGIVVAGLAAAAWVGIRS